LIIAAAEQHSRELAGTVTDPTARAVPAGSVRLIGLSIRPKPLTSPTIGCGGTERHDRTRTAPCGSRGTDLNDYQL